MGLFDRLGGGGPRAAFVGVDGVPFELVDDHPEVFENLHEIAEHGAGGRITSIVPPESSACWPALSTGRNPGATGVYGFQDRESGSYDTYVPLSHHVRAERVWHRVEADGRDATVLNVPVTFPPSDDVQRMVSGFLSPSVEAAASDDDVLAVLEDNGYRVDVDASLGHDDDKSEFIDDAHEVVDARQRVFRHYVEADDWDLFFGVFMTSDRVNHFLYGDYVDDGEYQDDFLEFYDKLDGYIGELRDALADDVPLVVASDHGFTKLEHEANCNEYLRRNDWLCYDVDGGEDGARDDGDD
ncbi:MAG: alkaline phosphatase family protein, partial [Halobacteriales archaeon]